MFRSDNMVAVLMVTLSSNTVSGAVIANYEFIEFAVCLRSNAQLVSLKLSSRCPSGGKVAKASSLLAGMIVG